MIEQIKKSSKEELKNVYTEAFYDKQKASSYRSACQIVPFVLKLMGTKSDISVLDMGCGIGMWLVACKDQGVRKVCGIDGFHINKHLLRIDETEFLERDLNEPIELGKQYDLVMSLEAAEHLPSENAQIFVDSLCRHGEVVLFSAAVPGQGGTHHVNEQWPSYWAEKFRHNNFLCIDVLRPKFWWNENVSDYYRQNVMLFIKRDSLKFQHIIQQFWECAIPLDVIHPRRCTNLDTIQYAMQKKGIRYILNIQKIVLQNFFLKAGRAFRKRM